MIDREQTRLGVSRCELARRLDMYEETLRRHQNGETSWRLHELPALSPRMTAAMRRDLVELVARQMGFRVSLLPLAADVRGASLQMAVTKAAGVVHQASRLVELMAESCQDGAIDRDEAAAISHQRDAVKSAADEAAEVSQCCAGRLNR